MIWTILTFSVWFLVDIAWLLNKRMTFRPVWFALSVIGSFGILVLLACSYFSTLPSRAPLRTVTGLATYRSSGVLSRHHWQFTLIEWKTGNRFLFRTTIDGPWADQPVLVTYADDGKYLQSVARIEILSEDQVPTWHVEKGHAGWVGTAEAKRRAPLFMSSIGLLLVVLNAVASVQRNSAPMKQGRNDLSG